MKLDNRTVQILRNFSAINPGLQFTKGKTLITVSPQTTTVARALLSEEIPSSFAIHDLPKFLGVLSLFETPEISLHDTNMTISSGQQKVHYTYADSRNLITPSEKLIEWLDNGNTTPDITFTLSNDVLTKVMNALKILQLPEIAITAKDGKLYVEAINFKNPSADTYSVEILDTELKFRMIFKAENIKLMPSDYLVGICSQGLATFKGADVSYWITSEATSTFEK